MPKVIEPLNDTKIRTAKPKEKDFSLTDGAGLYLLIKKTGSKIWRFQYTFEGKRFLTSFGKYPQVSLKKARDKRIVYQQLIEEGINPNEQKKQEKQEEVLNDEGQFHKVVYGWLETLEGRNAQKTLDKKKRNFERDIFPYFCEFDSQHQVKHSKHISQITHSDLLDVIKKKQVQSVETAHRLLNDCNRVWLYAISHNYCNNNITANISKKDSLKQYTNIHHAKITDENILRELLIAIDNYKGGALTRLALRLLCLLPLRAKNLFTLEWEHIDFKKELITIPRTEMKTKSKNFKDFVIPQSKQAIEVLKEAQELTGWGKWVFHGLTNLNTHMNLETCNKALRLMGFNDKEQGRKQRTHSFRGTFRSLCETYAKEHGATFQTMEAVLDHHEKNLTVRAYAHAADYTEQMRELLQWWGDFLDKIKTH